MIVAIDKNFALPQIIMIKQPNCWSCLPCSLAICIDESLEGILSIIGHDGSEVIYPTHVGSDRYRGFHIQEIIDTALLFDYYPILIEDNPSMQIGEEIYAVPMYTFRVWEYMNRSSGIIMGELTNGRYHAVAWNHLYKVITDSANLEVHSWTHFEDTIKFFNNIDYFLMLIPAAKPFSRSQ